MKEPIIEFRAVNLVDFYGVIKNHRLQYRTCDGEWTDVPVVNIPSETYNDAFIKKEDK
jgi:hypothetical protein